MLKKKTSIIAYVAIVIVSVLTAFVLEHIFKAYANYHIYVGQTGRIVRIIFEIAITTAALFIVWNLSAKKLKKDRENSKQLLKICFLMIMGMCAAIFAVEMFVSHGDSIYSLVFDDNGRFGDYFMDHFNSVLQVRDGIPYDNTRYTAGGMYPPFAYMLYSLLCSIMPNHVLIDGYVLRSSIPGLISLFVISMLMYSAIAGIIAMSWKGRIVEKVTFISLMFMSAPFIFLAERGNIIIVALIFSMIFIAFKDSEFKWARELAYISLAIAAAIKIYPALFGLLLLKDKKWSAAVRCVIYGLVLFTLPAFLFGGIPCFIQIARNTVNAFSILNQGIMYRVGAVNSLQYGLGWLFKVLNIPFGTYTLSCLFSFLLFTLSIVSIFYLKRDWKPVAIVSLLTILVVQISYIYALIFMIIPLILFLNERGKAKPMDYVYLSLFIATFAPVKFIGPIYRIGDITLSGILERSAVLLMLCLLALEGLITIIKLLVNKSRLEKALKASMAVSEKSQ